MKKKDYLKPTVQVVNLQQQLQLLAGSNPAPNSASIEDYQDGDFSWEARENDFEDFLQVENSQY